jgi:hypothetical protein
VDVERADPSGVVGLILALKVGILELVSVACCQQARGAVKIREISALQGRQRAGRGESHQSRHEDSSDEGLGY